MSTGRSSTACSRRPARPRSLASRRAADDPARRAASVLIAGVAVLGQRRLVLLPFVLGGYLIWPPAAARLSFPPSRSWPGVAVAVAALGGPQRRLRRLRHDHDRLPGALEGEQPGHARDPRAAGTGSIRCPNVPGAPPCRRMLADRTCPDGADRRRSTSARRCGSTSTAVRLLARRSRARRRSWPGSGRLELLEPGRRAAGERGSGSGTGRRERSAAGSCRSGFSRSRPSPLAGLTPAAATVPGARADAARLRAR